MTASDLGYAVAFVTMSVLALIGLVAVARLVRRPAGTVQPESSEQSQS
jgi:hypothetical protein